LASHRYKFDYGKQFRGTNVQSKNEQRVNRYQMAYISLQSFGSFPERCWIEESLNPRYLKAEA
jgi:hypothetical protein